MTNQQLKNFSNGHMYGNKYIFFATFQSHHAINQEFNFNFYKIRWDNLSVLLLNYMADLKAVYYFLLYLTKNSAVLNGREVFF